MAQGENIGPGKGDKNNAENKQYVATRGLYSASVSDLGMVFITLNINNGRTPTLNMEFRIAFIDPRVGKDPLSFYNIELNSLA